VLFRLLAVVERYPELKADTTMLQLMEELRTTENRIAFARQGYNDTVMEYNTAAASFPALLAARLFGFAEAKLFEIVDPKERAAVDVKF
jgi:LemA protein